MYEGVYGASSGSTGIPYLYLVLALLVAGYFYLWFYNTEMALRVSVAVGKVFLIIIKVVFKMLYWLFGSIVRLFKRKK